MVSEISLNELAPKISSESVVLVEALPPASYAAGHLPSAINVPLENFGKRASDVLADHDAEVVVYCASATCKNSHIAAEELRSLGYTRVRVFSGGKAAWKDAGFALEGTIP